MNPVFSRCLFLCSLGVTALLNSLFAQSTSFGYARNYGSTLSDQLQSLAADPFGNLVIGGSFSDSSDMDPGPGTFMIYGNVPLVPNGFVAKLDSAGNPRWAHSIGGQAYDDVLGVTTDAFGNVFACGYFRDTVDFDPGPGVFHLVSTRNPIGFFQEDGFVVKFDSTGNFRWAIQVAGPRVQQCTTIVADASGNVYVTGDFTDTLDLDPGPAVVQRVSNNTATDLFLIKLDSSGNYLWGFTLGDYYADRGAAVAVNAAGEVILGGTFGVNVDFNPGPGVDTLNAGFSEDGFLAKYSAAGNFMWARHVKSVTGGSNVEHLSIDPSGNIYATGLFSFTNQFDPNNPGDTLVSNGIYDAYIMKYTSAGQYLWAKGFGGTADDRFHNTALSGHDKLFMTGMLTGTIDFDPGSGVSNLTSFGVGDAYLLELDSAGNFVSVGQMGGTMNDTGRDIVVDANGRVVCGGYFMSTGDFNPGAGVSNLTSVGSQDVFLTIQWQASVITQGSGNIADNGDIVAYPNPVQNNLQISGLDAGLSYTYELLDIQGRTLQAGVLGTDRKLEIQTAATGVYYLKLSAPGKSSVHRILKGN